MCIRDHNAWLASNWFPIPGAGLGRPRGTRARAFRIRSTLHAAGIFVPSVGIGSKLNRTTRLTVKSRFTGGAQYYHSATWWFRCVHRRARCPTSRSRVHWREIYWTTCVYWTTPCVRNVCSFDTISLFLSLFFSWKRLDYDRLDFLYYFIVNIRCLNGRRFQFRRILRSDWKYLEFWIDGFYIYIRVCICIYWIIMRNVIFDQGIELE